MTEGDAGVVTGVLYMVFVVQLLLFFRDVMRTPRAPGASHVALEVNPWVLASAIALVALFMARLAVANWVTGGLDMGRIGDICTEPTGRVIMGALLVVTGFSLFFWRKRP